MKERIIEIVELGQPKSLIQRENTPITELIKTDVLIEELNEQLRLYNVNNNGLDEPFGDATTAELMLMFGKGVDEALDIHNDLEKIAKGDDV